MSFSAVPIPNLTISQFRRLREVLDLNPSYQREGGVWSTETRSRLIDSVINGFDVPKLYFERATARRTTATGLTIQYSVLDGKQRLEAISEFLDGQLCLPADFKYYDDESVSAENYTLEELRTAYPQLAQRVLDYKLPVVGIESDSIDLIEEMFQRLNASTALNHAERRNAVSGPTRDAVNALAAHKLLTAKSPIKSARYKYRELAAKFLVIEQQIGNTGRITDTKATTLYNLFIASRGPNPRVSAAEMQSYQKASSQILDRMAAVFEDNDNLLASIGTVVVYYIAFRDGTFATQASRDRLNKFELARRTASRMSDQDPNYLKGANVRLREYNVLVQSTNDGSALSRRAEILTGFVTGQFAALDILGDADNPSEELAED